MKRLAISRRFIFTLFAVLIGVNLWGQSSLSGSGTSGEPYIIASETDWNIFADKVNTGEAGYATAYYRLTADITVTTMVGTPEHPFSGTFNGRKEGVYNAFTLTFNCGSSFDDATNEEIVAPFRYTDGATIRELILRGEIHTLAGKEAGLIGVNTRTTTNTTVEYVINYMNFYCYEILWNEEGGGYAYDGSGISFSYCSYEGTIVASNYHGGFCGKADGNTEFTRCLFDPEGGYYWAENFVFDAQGATINYDGPNPAIEDGCYYSLGNNQQTSEQGTMIYVDNVPEGIIGRKITTFHEKKIYKPVTVVIDGVKKRYKHTGNNITVTPTVTFDGTNALTNDYCGWTITPSSPPYYPMHDVGQYTFTLTAPKQGVTSDYLGRIDQIIRVVNPTSSDWLGLQAKLSGADETITLTKDIEAGPDDAVLVIESGRTVTINLNNHTIDRSFYNGGNNWDEPKIGGQVLKIRSGANVIINGPGTIKGGYNKAQGTSEHAENSNGGGIVNWGTLTLNNVTVRDNKCVKSSDNNTSRTARGGGIYSAPNSTLEINGGEITNNSAEGGGGGMFVYRAESFTMNKDASDHKPNIHHNKSRDKGGGIRVDATNSTTATLNDCVIDNNIVEFYSTLSVSNGGGIHLDAGNLTLNRCEITYNQASKYGGGIYMMGGQLRVNDCSITNNKAYDATSRFDGCGGGICVLGGTCYLDGGTISDNSSSVMDGGGIFVEAGKTLSIKGAVNITGNWKYNSNTGGSTKTTNVYLMGSNGTITIADNITGSTIGISKNGDSGVFTKGLKDKGTIANFSSDNPVYTIELSNNEAQLTAILPVTPPSSGEWHITKPEILNSTLSGVSGIVIESGGYLYVNEGGVINGIPITNSDVNKLVINGGQVNPSNSGVQATVKKDIKKANSSSQKNWYLISSPLVIGTYPISIRENTNLIVKNFSSNNPEYDLYRFNEGATQTNANGQELQWENYRSTSPVHSGFNVNDNASTLEMGRGYLYRNINDYTIGMIGAINIGVESHTNYELSYHATVNSHDNVLKGFNIIGNPYMHDISKGIANAAIQNTYLETNYYVLNQENGSWILTTDGTVIPPLEGILVQAKPGGGTLTITNSTTVGGSKEVADNNIWFTVANSKYDDRACVVFQEGHGLNKMAHPNEEVPMLYIRHNDEDFASVDLDPATTSFNLNFEAKTMGSYTLSVKPQGEFGYLHLIDKVAEKDIDLLKEKDYAFIGSPSDAADRFIVRLNNNTDNSIFAYQSGKDIVVCGEGELQVFDVTGRLVMQKHVHGVQTIEKPQTTGVYILRLNENTQKIVVR